MAGSTPNPTTFSVMMATLVKEPFDQPGWIYEPKLDGERCLAVRDGANVTLLTRNKKTITGTYPELVAALLQQPSKSFALDGEVVAFEPGTTVSSFRQLQQRMHLTDRREIERSPVKIY